jgi:hypothetical protein
MKHLKILGLCLVSVLAMSMAVVASASAAVEQCGPGTEKRIPTKYTNHQCLAAATNNEGEWQWQAIGNTEEYRTRGSLKLADTKVPIVGKVVIECYGEGTGALGPGGHSRVTMIEAVPAKCRNIENCEEIKKIEARNLPWQAEIYDTEGGVSQQITGTGSGEPGWSIECKVLGISKEDECVSEASKPESTRLVNKETKNGSAIELLVLSTYQKLRRGRCTVGGAEAGEVGGSIAYLKKNGWGLRVS